MHHKDPSQNWGISAHHKPPFFTFNTKGIMRGLHGPHKTSTDDPAAIIGTQEPIFHLIIHSIGPLCHAAQLFMRHH